MAETKPPTAAPPAQDHEARLADRGDASGRNIEQSRAIGQDPPSEGSRMGREVAQTEEAAGDESARQ